MSLMVDVYGSFNEAIEELWTGGAPGVPFIVGEPTAPKTLPAECLRALWLEHGTAYTAAGETAGLIQLDLYVPGGNVAVALLRAQGLDEGMGLTEGKGFGRLELFDGDGNSVGWADVRSLEPIWLPIPDPSPGLVHLARTVELFWA